ncbi:MAG: hypothetical protein WCG05_04240 [Alphaproteobacteria bacterium]
MNFASEKNHRIYQFMSEPVRFLGLTVGELILGVGGFFMALLNTGKFSLQGFFLGGGIGSIIFLRQLKKQKIGTNVRSFLTHYGIFPVPSGTWPRFNQRRYY